MNAEQINLNSTNAETEIFRILLKHSPHEDYKRQAIIPTFTRIAQHMSLGKKLTFLLPAFPAKSPSPLKTSGILPDLGEVVSLMNLQKMCEEIGTHYAPGAEIIICSDGRVFSDVVDVSDEHIDAYGAGIEEIIREFNLHHLLTFSMDDVHPGMAPAVLRERLLSEFASTLEQVRVKVLTDMESVKLYNGMHRFMVEDQKGRSTLSKSQIHKEMKVRTYELMRRSDAWSQLLLNYFPEALRLSIHPHALESQKFGIKLVKEAQRWATPWHNVLFRHQGVFELMTKEEALNRGATEKMFGGKYAYFEL